jgi:hypothetical protein
MSPRDRAAAAFRFGLLFGFEQSRELSILSTPHKQHHTRHRTITFFPLLH